MDADTLRAYLNESKENRDEFVRRMIVSSVVQQVRSMMAGRGWTQADLAEQSGVSTARISEILNGDALQASLSTLKKLAAAFDVALEIRFCSFNELIGWAWQLEHVAPSEFAPCLLNGKTCDER